MATLAAKNRKGVLGRLKKGPQESSADIAGGLRHATASAEGRELTTAEALDLEEEIDLGEGRDRLDARKPIGKLREREDLDVDMAPSHLNLPKTELLDPSSMSARERRLAQVAAAAKSAEYQAALPSGGASKEALAEMRKTGRVADFEHPGKGFAERYDEDVRFQEEEYGGGSLERERALSEILGVDWRTERASPRREDLQEDGTFSFDEFYKEAKAANPEGPREKAGGFTFRWREEDWQDAAIKAYRKSEADRARRGIDRIEESVEDTAQVSGKMKNYEAPLDMDAEMGETTITPRLAESNAVHGAVSKIRAAGGEKKQGPTAQEAARKALAAQEAARKALAAKEGETIIPPSLDIEAEMGETTLPPSSVQEAFSMLGDTEREALSNAPGGDLLRPALDSLQEGNLAGFNEAFGNTPRSNTGSLLTPENLRDPLGWLTGRDNRNSIIHNLEVRTPRFKQQLASDLTKTLNKDNSEIHELLSKNLEGTITDTLYADYKHLGRDRPALSEAQVKEISKNSALAAKILMGLQIPNPRGRLEFGRPVWEAEFMLADNNPQYNTLKALTGGEPSDHHWLKQHIPPGLRERLRENYYATETLGRMSRLSSIQQGRFSVMNDANSRESPLEDAPQEESPLEDLIASLPGAE